jgi:hypothetical protein
VVLIGVDETAEWRTDTMADDLRMGLEDVLRKGALVKSCGKALQRAA